MKNERNAGRKKKITEAQIEEISKRHNSGESLSKLAAEYGVTKQGLSKRLKECNYVPIRLDYYVEGNLCSVIEADFYRETVHVINCVTELSKTAFGYELNPEWNKFIEFIETCYLGAKGIGKENDTFLLLENIPSYSLKDIEIEKDGKRIKITTEKQQNIPEFRLKREEVLLYKSDTDGYQMKALTLDRKIFVKSQAVMAGIKMRDHLVEIIATGICAQLSIPCVVQKACRLVYGENEYNGVYSSNFELDGYTFISFESLLEKDHLSSNDDEFIKLDSISKLKWCAARLSDLGGLSYETAEKYMIDLAVLDCLIGNVDRHTRNFGLFYNINKGHFEVPLVFDCGMGLFEHDHYRDRYSSFEAAMNNVYVSPYGEDPFEMLGILDKEYKIRSLYPGVETIDYGDLIDTPYALEYERRMNELWQRLD